MYGKILSKKTLKELGIKTVLNCLFLNKDNFKLEDVTDEKEKEFIRQVVKKFLYHNRSRKTCKSCEKSVKENGVVCGFHYHDYQLCHEDYCLTCLLHRSLGEATDWACEQSSALSEEEKWVKAKNITISKEKE